MSSTDAPTKSALRRIIAWRDSLYKAWAAKRYPWLSDLASKPPVKAKNPRRVEGGKKAAETRRRRKAAFIEDGTAHENGVRFGD